MTQPSETEPRPVIAAAVIVHDGRVLLVRRRVAEGALSWQLPAGEVEWGESLEAAAVRETAEETGLAVRAVQPLGQRVHPVTGRRMAYTACEFVAGVAVVGDEDEIDEVRWVSAGELPQLVPHGFYGPVQRHLDAALAQ